ncbi:MAG: endonuclease/exonuclease/phosphatase family protein, partial [Candidatus Pacebacteria bacterium]|nr:endonuclease/exonuclease/phosphatase family protein [Candidatus Paceibacterota bacterium]
MKITTWNVNGIRSVFDKGFLDWLNKAKPDILCLQEIKADFKELSEKYKEIDGYYSYFNSSSKRKGH